MRFAKGAKGLLVEQIQRAAGATVDGAYGDGTAAAVQSRIGVPYVDEQGWSTLLGEPFPSLFQRCLSLTAAFEGHGFTLAAGNWDGAGATWGIIGFTLKSGSLLEVLAQIPRPVLDKHLTVAGADELLALRGKDPRACVTWGADRSDPTVNANTGRPGHKLLRVWQERFASLGRTTEAQRAQMLVAESLYWHPSQHGIVQHFGSAYTSEPRMAALAFDCYVQQGGFTRLAIRNAQRLPLDQMLQTIAIEQAVGPWADDIRSRRMTIARSRGTRGRWAVDLSTMGLA